jgi:hypothetical protein
MEFYEENMKRRYSLNKEIQERIEALSFQTKHPLKQWVIDKINTLVFVNLPKMHKNAVRR